MDIFRTLIKSVFGEGDRSSSRPRTDLAYPEQPSNVKGQPAQYCVAGSGFVAVNPRNQPRNSFFNRYRNKTSLQLTIVSAFVKHVSYIKGGMQTKGISKQDPEASIWAQEG